MNLSCCPSCLRPQFNKFCGACLKKLFYGKRVSHILSFTRPEYNARIIAQGGRISISGVQSKYSLKLTKNILELTENDGQYILKPGVSGQFEYMENMPANEHVTMQIARLVFNLDIAENGLVFFSDSDTPAYITKRFDITTNGKLLQEDFAQIAQLSQEKDGKNYKYNFSYEKIALLMKKHVSIYEVEVEKLFKIIVFNYLVHNGDAHIKNFSLFFDKELKTYKLTPAYDLLNTRLHLPQESELALKLFENGFQTESFKRNGYHAKDDFFEFGIRLGIPAVRVNRFLDEMVNKEAETAAVIDRSFLDESLKTKYKSMITDRIRALRYSYDGRSE